jgi:ABC-type uncharacterized transport system permease subunit
VFIIRSVFAFVILMTGIAFFDISIEFIQLLYGLVLSVSGVVMFNGIYLMIQTLSFWIGDIEFLNDLLVDIEMNMLRLPQNILPTYLLFSLFIVIPVGLFSTIPTMMTFGSSIFEHTTGVFNLFFVMALLLLSFVMLMYSIRFFNLGLTRYEGIGE